jgi:hypothetical protein
MHSPENVGSAAWVLKSLYPLTDACLMVESMMSKSEVETIPYNDFFYKP